MPHMPRRKREFAPPSQTELLDITAKLRTAPCVPALREAVKAWKAGGYNGATDTTRILINHWFYTDHRLPTGLPFRYHASQQEAIETLVFVDTFELGKDKLRIITILPLEDRKEFDIGLPVLTPSLVRKKNLAEEIAALEVTSFQSIVLPMGEDDPRAKTFMYEGYDIITLKKEFEREYTIPEPQTAQEVIGYYARRIAEAVKLPAQFAALAPKVREFFEQKAFGHPANLNELAVVKAMSTAVAHYVCVDVFKTALQALTIEEQTPQLLEPSRVLSVCQPFPWSRPVWEGQKCIFNLVPCDNDFEREFAKFLDNASDVISFAKLPRAFGFAIEYTDTAMNLRNYEPDFVAIDKSGVHWLLESKGQENVDVLRKDVAAVRWCENASKLSDKRWKYAKVPQKEFESLQPRRLADFAALMPFLFDEAES
jgi:type III restriction enzyme